MIPVEKILQAIIDQAKYGSCKTCKWCRPCQTSWEVSPGHIVTRECEIQGNVNSIWFTAGSLNEKPYPWVCEVGDFNVEEGCLLLCLAYQPTDGEVVAFGDDKSYSEASATHREFMYDLAEAVRLYFAIKENTLAKLTAKLNEAMESLRVKV